MCSLFVSFFGICSEEEHIKTLVLVILFLGGANLVVEVARATVQEVHAAAAAARSRFLRITNYVIKKRSFH